MTKVFFDRTDLATRNGVNVQETHHWAAEHPTFPAPIELQPGTERWRLLDLEAWERGGGAVPAADKGYLSAGEVSTRYGIRGHVIFHIQEHHPDFPEPYQLYGGKAGWLLSELKQWETAPLSEPE